MAAVLASKERVERACERQQGRVEVAADNGPESVVISGHAGSVEAVARELEGEGIRVERLRVSHGFHSPEMEPVEEAFEAAAGRVRYGTPQVEMVSTVTGGVVTGEAMGRPEYWRRQLRQRVEFAGAMGAVAARGARVFVEIGPGSTLLGMGQELMGAEGQVWAPSIRRSRADGEQMAESAALLWTQGVEVNWEQREAGRVHRRVPLPTYPFQRQRYWIDGARPAAADPRRRRGLDTGERRRGFPVRPSLSGTGCRFLSRAMAVARGPQPRIHCGDSRLTRSLSDSRRTAHAGISHFEIRDSGRLSKTDASLAANAGGIRLAAGSRGHLRESFRAAGRRSGECRGERKRGIWRRPYSARLCDRLRQLTRTHSDRAGERARNALSGWRFQAGRGSV